MRRALFFLTAFTCLSVGVLSPWACVAREHALYGAEPPDSGDIECSGDKLGVARNGKLINARKVFSSIDNIEYVSCVGGKFQVVALDGDGGDLSFELMYPFVNGKSGATGVINVAPYVHELAHVYQISRAEGFSNLKDSFCLIRIELGADYLTGIIYKNYLKSDLIKEFQENVELTGSFNVDGEEFHGSPAQRTAAFRYGYMFPFHELNGDIDAAYDYFQSDFFRAFKSSFTPDQIEECDI